ncbi:L-histidine N(alpha)-methyltransferase [Calothrix sp. 336/3]|uniref:L-histidine N(alpha)-methyltransferase n=1 Tax=Calothrix sp. 336/3 TaxID=1337936 RepID=UPI0004E28E74|nr:L-histidine N(alpha)-methyltransferase [Calothrix sp. 336/3]AKG21648.1 hypothetical protein IJ00_10565 [Calothrix sp. 336/3]
MAPNLHNSQFSPSQSNLYRHATPNSEFYSHFSQAEILEIIYALETRREIPLKFSYKGKGAKIWDNFYQKYIVPTWYRSSNVERDLLKDNFSYLNGDFQGYETVNIIDVGAGNSYPVKDYIRRLQKLGKINNYVALDISSELLELSRLNFTKWFPKINIITQNLDIENTQIHENLRQKDNKAGNIFLHLGVTMGNHQNRHQVLLNFRDSMTENDFLVFTNENGSSSKWNGKVRGGCDYHAGNIYKWMQGSLGVKPEDCELIRKYDSVTDSVVANLKVRENYNLNFQFMEVSKNVEISAGEEITIWRHHKFEIADIVAEIEALGFQLVHCSTNKYASHMMIICRLGTT